MARHLAMDQNGLNGLNGRGNKLQETFVLAINHRCRTATGSFPSQKPCVVCDRSKSGAAQVASTHGCLAGEPMGCGLTCEWVMCMHT